MKEFIEKLISRLEEAKVSANRRNAFDSEVSYACAIGIVNKLAEEYKVSEIPTGWIPCSERLPKPGKRYLVSGVWKDKDFEKHSVYDAVYGSDGLWHSHNYEPVSYEVLAWMPLPAPYQPKGE